MKALEMLPRTGLVLLIALAACNQQPAKQAQSNSAPANTATQQQQQATGERHRGLKKACATELAQYCPGDQRGRARKECLQSHADQLSADCKAALDARGAGRGGRRRGL
jgi:hypothetical protein